MKLHTDFQDYYDYAVGYGVDKNVHYNRFSKSARISIKSQRNLPHFQDANLLGFCGEIYPFITIKKFNRKYDSCEFDSDELKVVETFHAYSYKEYKNKEAEWEDYSDSFGYMSQSMDLKLKQFFLDWRLRDDAVFLEHKVPVWKIELDEPIYNGTLNPRLKDYNFEVVKDAFTAFQEISMYLSNILIEQKEIAEIEDKYRIEQHGFDKKLSFRHRKKSQ